MSTVVTALSPNTSVISFSQDATLAEVMSAVNDEIVNEHGWTLHDDNAGNNVKCYRSVNKDGETYKYMTLDWSTNGKVNFAGYGAWDELAHVGTMKAQRTDGSWSADLNLTDRGNFYLFISPRWFAFCIKQYSSYTIYSSSQAAIGGVFEIARDNPDDTVAAGLPPFCALTTGFCSVLANANPSNYPTLLLPKSLSGTDNQFGEFSTIFGKTNKDSANRMIAQVPTAVNPVSNKDWAITPYVHGPGNEIRGRIFGLKFFTQNKLYFMDKVSVMCDQDFMYDPTGTATDHYIVPGSASSSSTYNVRCLIPS